MGEDGEDIEAHSSKGSVYIKKRGCNECRQKKLASKKPDILSYLVFAINFNLRMGDYCVI